MKTRHNHQDVLLVQVLGFSRVRFFHFPRLPLAQEEAFLVKLLRLTYRSGFVYCVPLTVADDSFKVLFQRFFNLYYRRSHFDAVNF